MTFDGADTAALTTLAGQMGRAADDLDHVVASMGSTLGSTQWTGADAARFRSTWDSDSARALRAASSALRDAGRRLVAEARQQDQASAADGGSMGGAALSGIGLSTGAAGDVIGRLDALTPGGLANLGALTATAGAMGIDKALGIADDVPGAGTALSIVNAGMHLGEAGQALLAGDPIGVVGSMLTSTSDALKVAPPMSPLHLAGSALGIWTFVGEEAVKADFPNTWGPTMDYIRTNPMDAMGGAFEGITNSATSIIGAVL